MRRLDFDLQALGAVAAQAAGASACESIGLLSEGKTVLKTTQQSLHLLMMSSEGQLNRIFLLTMNSGAEVIARMPFPNAGPRSLMTRSEVATMDFDFVRTRLGAPVPKVLAWDATSHNSVGCEYIIMERRPGDDLFRRIDQSAQSSDIVFALASFQADLSSLKFSQIGSLYYKEDVDENLQARPLYAPGTAEDECSHRFRIGPSVDRRFYRGERARLRIDRGPCMFIDQ
jgi:hypothetical protein